MSEEKIQRQNERPPKKGRIPLVPAIDIKFKGIPVVLILAAAGYAGYLAAEFVANPSFAAFQGNDRDVPSDGWEAATPPVAGSGGSESVEDDGWAFESPSAETTSQGTAACSHTSKADAPASCCAAPSKASAMAQGQGADIVKGGLSGSTPACCASGAGTVFTAESIQAFKAQGDWCASHSVPESMCTLCNPSLVADFKARGDWCAGHDLPESQCALCNANLAALGVGRDWCATHGLPASQCSICKAGLKNPIDEARPELAASALPWGIDATKPNVWTFVDQMKAGGTADETVGNPALRRDVSPNCLLHHQRIRLENPGLAQEAGIEVHPAASDRIAPGIACFGQVQYNRGRYALLSPRAEGIVESVEVEPGRQIREGDVLAWIDSTEIGKAKADYLRALSHLKQRSLLIRGYRRTNGSGAIARAEIWKAESDLESASIEAAIAGQSLLNLGLTESDLKEIRQRGDTNTRMAITAPFSATVVDRQAVRGEVVDRGSPLFALADLGSMWVEFELPEDDLQKLEVGSPAIFKTQTGAQKPYHGKIVWIEPGLDERTRRGTVRAEVENSDGTLRAGQFADGWIPPAGADNTVTVPNDAVQWDGCCNVVFVQEDPGVYLPRKVRLGDEWRGRRAVLAGLLPGENVVTTGSYLLKTEILKGSIGAGCCGNE